MEAAGRTLSECLDDDTEGGEDLEHAHDMEDAQHTHTLEVLDLAHEEVGADLKDDGGEVVDVPRAEEEGRPPPRPPVGRAGDEELDAEEEVEDAIDGGEKAVGSTALGELELGHDDVCYEVAEDCERYQAASIFMVRNSTKPALKE